MCYGRKYFVTTFRNLPVVRAYTKLAIRISAKCRPRKSDKTARAHIKSAAQYRTHRFINFLSASQPEATRDIVLTILINDISHTAFWRLKCKKKNNTIKNISIWLGILVYWLQKEMKHIFYCFVFFWSKGIYFKFNIAELFCFLILNICAAFEVATKSCVIFFWRKVQKSHFGA